MSLSLSDLDAVIGDLDRHTAAADRCHRAGDGIGARHHREQAQIAQEQLDAIRTAERPDADLGHA